MFDIHHTPSDDKHDNTEDFHDAWMYPEFSCSSSDPIVITPTVKPPSLPLMFITIYYDFNIDSLEDEINFLNCSASGNTAASLDSQ